MKVEPTKLLRNILKDPIAKRQLAMALTKPGATISTSDGKCYELIALSSLPR